MENDNQNANEKIRFYDAHAKSILTNRHILARIIKGVVEEYHDIDVDDIATHYIEGTPSIDTSVDREDYLAEKIEGRNTEDTTSSEGEVRFDILFNALVPGNNGQRNRIIINVEAQSNDNPGYSIIRRGLYYCSRLISSQKNVEFSKSDYDRIKKVYSIWICYNCRYNQNTITRYNLNEESIVGTANADKCDYDLMQMILIRLGDHITEEEGSALHMLDIIFSRNLVKADKKALLIKSYGLTISKEVGKEMENMCNLGEGIFAEGVAQGISQGIVQGISQERTANQAEQKRFALLMDKLISINDLDTLKEAYTNMELRASLYAKFCID